MRVPPSLVKSSKTAGMTLSESPSSMANQISETLFGAQLILLRR